MRQNQFPDLPKELFNKNKDQRAYAEKIDGKPIGYLKDAMIRFSKNIASVTALVMLLIIVLFTLFGPVFSSYSSDETYLQSQYLAPKIPGLEHLGIADGIKTRDFQERSLAQIYERIVSLETATPGRTITVLLKKGDDVEYAEYTKEDIYALSEAGYTGSFITENDRYIGLDHTSILGYEVLETNTTYDKSGNPITSTQLSVEYDQYELRGIADDVYHLFGTTKDGKDLYVLTWEGTRTSLLIGTFAAVINLIIGIIYGSISGYFGGNVDIFMQRFTEIIGSVPWFVVFMLYVLYFGQGPASIMMALVITGWIGISRVTRIQFLRYRNREYVLAARSLGVNDRKLMFRHILPNGIGTLVTSTVLIIPGAIFSEAALSYLGLGVQGTYSLGLLLKDGQLELLLQPHALLFPALIISILMLSFNLIGNGLRDALNPSLRGQ